MGGDTKRLSVIPFGVDESLFQVDRCEEKREKFTFGIVKKMEPVYNVELFLDAFVLLAKKYDHLECVVYGGGSLLDVLREKYSEEGIVFYGWIENSEVPVAYSRMDVAVIPSLSESFGVSAIEAAMCGVPVIASRVGGLPEIVEDGKVGLLFRSDDVNDLYSKMENILLDENKFNSIRLQCRRAVITKYSIDHTTRIQNELYNEFIK
jgi:glycosyltransferase involved in cell wall biosynthesis